MTDKKNTQRASFFKALSHPTRVFIVDKLADSEKCVCELTEMVGVDISTISRHLSILKNERIITEEKRGKNVYYSLRCKCVLDLFDCIETLLNTSQ